MRFQPRVPTDVVGTAEHKARIERESFTLVLEPRSLVVFTGDAYSNMLHSLDLELEEVITDSCCNRNVTGMEIGDRIDRRLRTSFTIRHVPAVDDEQ